MKKPEQVAIPGNGAASKIDQVPTIGTEGRPAGPRPKRKAGAAPAAAGQQPPREQPAPTRRKIKNSLWELQKRSGEPEAVRDDSEVWYPVKESNAAEQSGKRGNTSAPSTSNGISNGFHKQAQSKDWVPPQSQSIDWVPPQPSAQRAPYSSGQRASSSNGEDGVGADPPMLGAKIEEADKVKSKHLLALFSMGGLDPGGSGGLQGHARQEEEEEPFSVQEEVLEEIVQDRQIDFKDVNMTFG